MNVGSTGGRTAQVHRGKFTPSSALFLIEHSILIIMIIRIVVLYPTEIKPDKAVTYNSKRT